MEPKLTAFTKYDIPVLIWPGILIGVFAVMVGM